MKFTFGTDPEFVLMKNGKAFSAIPVINHDKDNRKRIKEFFYFSDNVLAECSMPPASSKEEAVKIIGECLANFVKLVKPYDLVAQASCTFDPKQLTDPAAMEISCSPEICAYDLAIPIIDETIFEKTNLRSCGGHIHLGHPMLLKGYNTFSTVRMLDLFLGLPSIFIDHDEDSAMRRELYGKAGRFRECSSYGLEYRSLGNFWLTSPKLVELVYDICDFVLEFVEKEQHKKLWNIDEEKINNPESWKDPDFTPASCHICIGYDVNGLRTAIDKTDKKLGKKYMSFIKEYMPNNLFARIEEFASGSAFNLKKEWNI